jgi:hypothetical protein
MDIGILNVGICLHGRLILYKKVKSLDIIDVLWSKRVRCCKIIRIYAMRNLLTYHF